MTKVQGEEHFKAHQQRLDFHRKLRAHNLAEGYSYDEDRLKPRPYWPTQPINDVEACLWNWKTLKSIIQESGELVGLGHGKLNYDRRVIALTNPGLASEYAVTTSFFADFQVIRPGESTPSHRHTPCATRFIFEGKGHTTVGNENVDFEAGDIIFTGQFPWHDHGNRGDTDLLFLDVLDIPLLQFLGVSKWEFDYPTITGSKDNHSSPYEVKNFDDTLVRRADLRLCGEAKVRNTNDLNILRFKEVRELLVKATHKKGSLYDGIMCEFTNTETQGPVGPTMSVFTQMLRTGEKTLEHRHTSQTIYVGVEGRGKITIDGKDFEWGPNDVFVVPSWRWHSHENLHSGPSFLHSISDASLISKINLFREQRKLPNGEIEDTNWTNKYFESL
jgi:gentisate 1,2-dioxygenase